MVLYAHFNSALFGITFNIYLIIDLKKYTDSWLLKKRPNAYKDWLTFLLYSLYSRTSVARTLMAHLPRRSRTRQI